MELDRPQPAARVGSSISHAVPPPSNTSHTSSITASSVTGISNSSSSSSSAAGGRPLLSLLVLRLLAAAVLVCVFALLSSIPGLRRSAHDAVTFHATAAQLGNLLRTSQQAIVRDGWAEVQHLPDIPASSAALCARLASDSLPYYPGDAALTIVQSALAAYYASGGGVGDHEQVELARRCAAAALNTSLEEGAVASTLKQGLGCASDLVRALLQARQMLVGTGRLLGCTRDELLVQEAVRAHAQPGGSTLRVAAILYNSHEILPNMVHQLLLLAVTLPHEAVLISIYESGSTDRTAFWLHLLRLLLCPLGVQYRIEVGGKLQRARDPDTERLVERIQFLAQVRNTALEPLITGELGPAAQANAKQQQQQRRRLRQQRRQTQQQHQRRQHQHQQHSQQQHHQQRQQQQQGNARLLLEHSQQQQQQQGDSQLLLEQQRQRRQRQRKRRRMSGHHHDPLDSNNNGGSHSEAIHGHDDEGAFDSSRMPGTAYGAAGHKLVFVNDVFFCMDKLLRLVMLGQDLACGLDLHSIGISWPTDKRQLWLYDSWVSRDIQGNMIPGMFPEMRDPWSTVRAKAGLPFPAYCCWNGMAVINMEPLLRGVRIRSSLPGECRASECSLLCDDLHRLGFGRVAIDPTVYTTYHFYHAQAVMLNQEVFDPGRQIQQTTWKQVLESGPMPGVQANTSNVLCCNKAADSDAVDWGGCAPTDVMRVNYTRLFLEQRREGS